MNQGIVEEKLESGWRQHYPTYAFAARDIALEEYRTAAKSLEAEERVFLNASNMAALAAAGLGSLAVGSLGRLTDLFKDAVPAPLTLFAFLTIVCGFSWVGLRYFADRQKAIAYASRKVIVLRRMLGLSYGTIQLVLPNWRVEGADEPYAVRLFPGWNTYVAYPYYALAGITSVVLFFLLASLIGTRALSTVLGSLATWQTALLVSLLWGVLLASVYRQALLDIHETQSLLIIRLFARALILKLVSNHEYIIYRATLARYEFQRLGVDLSILKNFLIFIEDREFYKHHGLSMKGIARALLGVMRIRRRSGGSTITQQLVRTLFIIHQTKVFRRKVVEILLARWFHRVVTKNAQLEMYLASVRFEQSVYGAIAAMQYFWGRVVKQTSKAEAFFLIERVSNIRSQLLADKVVSTVRAAVKMKIMDASDARELVVLYSNAVKSGKILDYDSGIGKLTAAFGDAGADNAPQP